ncbi:MAG: hypothetical protein M3Z98_04150 [Candidatus Dormibacteraeota bacterium]|nr:hypothetical protein [Candidatus Dormibacteraeota bacterium]
MARGTREQLSSEPEVLQRRITGLYRRHVDYRRAAALRLLIAFAVTFAAVRALTFGIRYHLVPINNIVTSGGLHIHHYVWGLLIVLVVGFLALTLEQALWHPLLAIPFGVGAALILDEFALLLNLQDVYWAKEGRVSVDAVVLVLALLAVYLVADRFWRAAAGEVAIELRRLARSRRR